MESKSSARFATDTPSALSTPTGLSTPTTPVTTTPSPGVTTTPSPAVSVAAAAPGAAVDPMCDPANPRVVTFQDITAASYRIMSGIIRSLCIKSRIDVGSNQMDIYLKNEWAQTSGCFKERGARNALLLLTDEQKKAGVICGSFGNHSLGLTCHAQLLGIPATVVMPVTAPMMKIQKCRSYGAEVIVSGQNLVESVGLAQKICKEKNLSYINGYDHPAVIAGQGTVGLEILEQVPDVEAVLVPCGGGGLVAGIAVAVKAMRPKVLVYAIETEHCPSMTKALEMGAPTMVDIKPTLADGLAVSKVGVNVFATCSKLIDKTVVVKEDYLARAILALVEQQKYVVEGGAAAPIAAIMAGQVSELAGKKVVCVLTGGNIDTTVLGRCLERGLAVYGRLIKFRVTVREAPGSYLRLCTILADLGVSIKYMFQERAWVYGDVFSVTLKLICEVRGPEHADELKKVLVENYDQLYFPLEEMLKSPSAFNTRLSL